MESFEKYLIEQIPNIDYTNDMMLNQQRAFERMVPVNEAIEYIRKNTKSNENENKINMSK